MEELSGPQLAHVVAKCCRPGPLICAFPDSLPHFLHDPCLLTQHLRTNGIAAVTRMSYPILDYYEQPQSTPQSVYALHPALLKSSVAIVAGVLQEMGEMQGGYAWACQEGRLELLHTLKCCDDDDEELLLMASECGHIVIVDFLLDRCNNRYRGIAALANACYYGHIDIARSLIEKLRMDVSDHDHLVALTHACMGGQFDVVEMLLDRGAGVHVDHALGTTCAAGKVAMARLLLDRGADIDADNGYALYIACYHCDMDIVQLLLEHGADVHADEDGALLMACSEGHIEVVRLLLAHGADVHADEDGALRSACREGHIEVVRLLLAHGADVHASDDQALLHACGNGHVDITRLLLDRGAGTYFALEQAMSIAADANVSALLQRAKATRLLSLAT